MAKRRRRRFFKTKTRHTSYRTQPKRVGHRHTTKFKTRVKRWIRRQTRKLWRRGKRWVKRHARKQWRKTKRWARRRWGRPPARPTRTVRQPTTQYDQQTGELQHGTQTVQTAAERPPPPD